MPGVAIDGSEDRPWVESSSVKTSPAVPPAMDYLSQKLANAYGELKILDKNIELLNQQHMNRLIDINYKVVLMISSIKDKLEEEAESAR